MIVGGDAAPAAQFPNSDEATANHFIEGVMTWRQVEAALVHYVRSNLIEVTDLCGTPSIAVHRSKFNDQQTTFGPEALAKFLAGELGP